MSEEGKTAAPGTNPSVDPFATPAEPTPQPDPVVPSDPMSDWVGEGKKYATPEAAINALAHSQSHIARLEAENKAFREQMAKAQAQADQAKTVKELIAEAIQQQGSNSMSTTATPASAEPTDPPQPQGVSQAEVAKMVSDAMAKSNREEMAQRNLSTVTNKLIQIYGTEAPKVTREIADRAGMSPDELKQLSMTHPQAVLNMVQAQAATPATPDLQTAPGAALPSGRDLHGLPQAHAVRPPGGEYKPTPLRNADRNQLLDAWRDAYPTEAVEELRKQGQL